MEIFTFDKSLQERLVEFSEILSNSQDVVPSSQIHSEWSYHVELVIEPVGWQALWKIPRLTCEDFEIHYPTIVLVEVEQVNFAELSALVKIIAVQEEIHLPEQYDVPLTELYPTQSQKNTALDMVGTAVCIDQLRFFFNYLWMPWDIDDDEDSDWVKSHLETRIRLFFDMKRGAVNKDTCDVIRTLVRKGREIKQSIGRLEASITDEEEEREGSLDEGKACQLMSLHFTLQQIKNEMELLENPAMRELLARNQVSTFGHPELKDRRSRGQKQEGFFVSLGASLVETIECLEKAKSVLGADIFIKVSADLQDALRASERGDIVILSEGEHRIRSAGGLEEGGTIRGIGEEASTILCPKEADSGPSLLDFSGEVLLENVSIDLGELPAGILARKGTIKLQDCTVFVSNPSVVKLGVVVLPGAKLVARKCTFKGLGTAIVVHSGADVSLNECNFQDCIEGVQLNDDAVLTACLCSFTNFKEYGIRMETQKYLKFPDTRTGSQELLANIKEISLESCKFDGNGKGDVTLRPRVDVVPTVKQDVTLAAS